MARCWEEKKQVQRFMESNTKRILPQNKGQIAYMYEFCTSHCFAQMLPARYSTLR